MPLKYVAKPYVILLNRLKRWAEIVEGWKEEVSVLIIRATIVSIRLSEKTSALVSFPVARIICDG